MNYSLVDLPDAPNAQMDKNEAESLILNPPKPKRFTYINRLEQENKEKKEKLNRINEEITLFLDYLHSSKFVGVESDGERKDWISTTDVVHKLFELRSLALCS